MDIYKGAYWLYIIGGNIFYFLILGACRRLMQKTGTKGLWMGLMAIILAADILLTSWLEMRLPRIVFGGEADAPPGVRLVAGIVYSLMYFTFIPLYQFMVLKLKLYLRREDRYVLYVYHDDILFASMGVWFVLLLCQMFMVAALTDYYRSIYDWTYGGARVLSFIGGIGLMILRQKTLVITGDRYSYRSFNKSFEGKLADIQSVEEIRGGVILHTDSTGMRIKCSQKPYIDLLRDRLSDIAPEPT